MTAAAAKDNAATPAAAKKSKSVPAIELRPGMNVARYIEISKITIDTTGIVVTLADDSTLGPFGEDDGIEVA